MGTHRTTPARGRPGGARGAVVPVALLALLGTAAGPLPAGVAGTVPSAATGAEAVASGEAGPSGEVGPDEPAQRGAHAAAERAATEGVDWAPCAPEHGLPDTAECGTVSVPLDYTEPTGVALELHVSRAKATGPAAERRGALLYNPGGPGGSGLDFPTRPDLGGVWQDLNGVYDLVGLAPRGVAPSAALSCVDPEDPEERATDPHPAPRVPSEAYKQRMNDRAAAYAAACRSADREGLLPHLTTPNNARDLHTVNAALGEAGLSYLGVSYGSYLGAVYATLFPTAVDRMVLDSVVDPRPDLVWYRNNLRQSLAFEGRWRQWAAWVAQHDATYGLGTDATTVLARVDAALEGAERGELGAEVGGRELHDVFQTVVYADPAWHGRASALAAFERGDPGPLATLARPDAAAATQKENARAVYTAVECVDGPWPRSWARWEVDHTRMAASAPFMTWENAWLNLPCAHWPVPAGEPVDVGAGPADGLPPVLLVQATGDGVTPLSGAVETHRRLAGSSLVTEEGAGHHGVTGGNRCADELVRAYLLDGATPGPRARCPARPTPDPR